MLCTEFPLLRNYFDHDLLGYLFNEVSRLPDKAEYKVVIKVDLAYLD